MVFQNKFTKFQKRDLKTLFRFKNGANFSVQGSENSSNISYTSDIKK